MLRLHLLSAALLLFSPGCLARIWRINNNGGVDADYTTAQAAHDAATTVNGDTLHFEASQASYGSLDISKRLTLIGPGYFLNQNPNTQADPRPAYLDGMNVNSGAAGTQVMGLTIGAVYVNSISNLLFQRNRIAGNFHLRHVNATAWGNVILLQNVIEGALNDGNFSGGTLSGLQISNNLLHSIGFSALTSATITNNVVNTEFNVWNSVVRNNIMTNQNGGGAFQPNNNQFTHNMGAGFGTTSNNLPFPGLTTIFVATGSQDGYFQLAPGASNPARGSGFGGVDQGAFGGPTPYRLSGLPAVPSITNLVVPPAGVGGAPLNVTISVQSNN